MKKFLTIMLAFVMLFALAVPVSAAGEQTIYLKGEGSEFTETWQDVFYLGGTEDFEDPSVWHLVYTGKDTAAISAMQLDFGENGIWKWNPEMGFSTNSSGKNPGWVIVAPGSWTLSHAEGSASNSFVVTAEFDHNPQFNISGFHQGDPDEGKLDTEIAIIKYLNDTATFGVGFEFDVFPAGDQTGAPLATLISDENGEAKFKFDYSLPAGSYIVRERLPEGFAAVDDLVFTVDNNGVATFVDDINYIVNINLGALEVTDDVVELYNKEHHKPVYRMYNYGTLVSWSNTINGAPLPAGITGDMFLKNGMTYLKINKAALENLGERGATIGIAESNKPGKSVNGGWNTPVAGGKSYNLKIVGGKLIVTSDLPGFGAAVYANKNAVKGPQDIKHNEVTEYDLPEGNEFYFFFHIGSASYHLGEVIGCEFDYYDPDGPFERLFPGEVTMTVINAEGTELYNGPLGKVEDLLAGDYTVTVLANGTVLDSKTITVLPGETAKADFGKLTVLEPGENEIICDICNPI